MFWGSGDATVKFCESPYENSKYIAEYYNSLSGLIYVIIGLLYKSKYKELGLCSISLGIGTFLLHCTQSHFGQMLDELSMLILIYLFLNKFKEKVYKKKYIIWMVLLYIYYNNNFIVFLVLFTTLIILLVYETKNLNIKKKNYRNLFIILMSIGTLCWILDQVVCFYVKDYYLHAIWHILTGLSLYIGFKILI